MSPQRSTSATISSRGNCSVFKYSRPLCIHNWNHNNKYASSLQSRAPEQDQRQSYLTDHSLKLKRHAHLVPDNIPETSHMESLLQETAAPFFQHTLLNYFHSQGHTKNDPLKQESVKTNGQDNTSNATIRQDTLSTLNKWSPLSEEKPSYSKFTLGLSASIFSSLLFPQQVTYEKRKTSQTSRHSSKFVKRDDSVSRLRSPTLPAYMQHDPDTSIRSSTSSFDNTIDLDTSSFLSTSSLDDTIDPDTSGRSSTSSCSDEETSFSPTVRYNLDSATLFGDLDSTTPAQAPRDRRKKKVVRRPPTPSSARSGQQSGPTPSSVGASNSWGFMPRSAAARQLWASEQPRVTQVQVLKEIRQEKQRGLFKMKQNHKTREREQQAARPRRAKPESAYLSDFPSPYRNHSSRSEEGSSLSSLRGADGGIEPPCLNICTVLSEEPPSRKVKVLTDKEFYHFLDEKELAAVMFYKGPDTNPDTLKVWDREASEKTELGDRVYGSVDCATERQLCRREAISSCPYYKMYARGFPVNSAKHFKMWK